MEIKAEEISKIIREQIDEYRPGLEVNEVGSVISVGDGIARVYGLEKAMAGELLEFPHGVMGLALNLEESQVGVVQATSPQTFYFLTHLAPLFRSATQPGQVVASIRGRFEDFKKLFETIHEYVFLANYCLLALKGFVRIAAAPWK